MKTLSSLGCHVRLLLDRLLFHLRLVLLLILLPARGIPRPAITAKLRGAVRS